MSFLTRKHLLLSQENLSNLREWSKRYQLSEAELVRRAIQAYEPEEKRCQPVSAEREREADEMLCHIERALKSALEAVDGANIRMTQTLAGFDNAVRRAVTVNKVQEELAENPGWLDEMSNLLVGQNERDA